MPTMPQRQQRHQNSKLKPIGSKPGLVGHGWHSAPRVA